MRDIKYRLNKWKRSFWLFVAFHKIVYRWYYRRVDPHFHQWTFKYSVIMLNQHYDHAEFRLAQNDKLIANAIENEKKLMREIASMRMQQLGNPELIRKGNKIFGTDLPEGNEN